MSKLTIVRLALLSLCLIATAMVGFPVQQAEAADCGAPWGYYGCCYVSGRVTMKQYQVCCNNGSCTTNYRCTSSACPV
ncbi:MAG TPA: hypothetical protein VJ725_04575 [Thermoanaerobaculia bacterium]|nr:hypothetical protein [Thermoanaerobaculia bacterium]